MAGLRHRTDHGHWQAEAAVGQAVDRFGRLDVLIAVNVQGLLHTTHAALPHLLQAAEEGPRQVADIVNISSIAGRRAWANYGVYNLIEFGVNGFTESLRQELAGRHVRVGVLEPGAVDADGIAFVVTRPRRAAIAELWVVPTDQA